jgi:NDP-sugar pyrophosphorylase family protein
VFDTVEPGAAASSVGGIYDAWIATQPGAIRGLVADAAFFDVGTPGDYWRASLAIAAMEGTTGSSVGAGTRIDASAHVRHSVLWDDVQVGADVHLDECIVADGVQVPAGASHRRAILVRGEDDELLVAPLSLES